MVLDPQVSPEEIRSREVELGLKVGLLLHQLFLNSRATDIGPSIGHQQLVNAGSSLNGCLSWHSLFSSK